MTKEELIPQLKAAMLFESRLNEQAFPDHYEYLTVDNDWLIDYYAIHRKVPNDAFMRTWRHDYDAAPCDAYMIGADKISVVFGFESPDDAILFKLAFINA
jgi:hypothetical protein